MIFGKHINRYYLKYSPILLLGILSLLLVDYFQLEIPEIYKMVIDGANNGFVMIDGARHEFDVDFVLNRICRPFIVIILAMIAGRFLWRICFFGSAIRVETDLRREMFNHCKGLSQQYYHTNKVGNMMSLFTNDIDTVNECFGDGVLMLFDALLLGGFAVYKMAKMDATLLLFSLIPMVFLFIVSTIVGKFMMKKWETRQEAFSKLSDFSQESFSGIAVIKAFVKEFRELWAFKRLSRENEKANVDFTKISTLLHISVMLFVETVICVILGYGGYLVYNGNFTAGELIEFISYFTTIVWPVMAISNLIEMSSRGKASMKRIAELLDAKADVVDSPDVKEVDFIGGDIEFKNVTYSYDATKEVLHNVSLKVEAGKKIALVGPSGGGKTTICHLLPNFYKLPDNGGAILIDGKDIRELTMDSVRRNIGIVQQDVFLFVGTIRDNIIYGKPDATDEEIVTAARRANIHDYIMTLPNGYDTEIGERGVKLSGGQKQRISIARVFLKDPAILILDEATSALDNTTELLIQEALDELCQGRTTLVVAHRLSTVRGADEIAVITDGTVTERGTHEQLMASGGLYKELYSLQFRDSDN